MLDVICWGAKYHFAPFPGGGRVAIVRHDVNRLASKYAPGPAGPDGNVNPDGDIGQWAVLPVACAMHHLRGILAGAVMDGQRVIVRGGGLDLVIRPDGAGGCILRPAGAVGGIHGDPWAIADDVVRSAKTLMTR